MLCEDAGKTDHAQSPVFMVVIMDINRNVSPKRLVSMVSIPALSERWLL